MPGWGSDPYGGAGAGGTVEFRNLSFEAPGTYCGLPDGWTIAYVNSIQNLIGWGPECLGAWETFARGWSDNENYAYSFTGTAANYNAGSIYIADTAYEAFEAGWSGNEGYSYTLTNANAAEFDTANEAFEDFEEEWSNDSYVYSFTGTNATFDAETSEDFEEQWSNDSYVYTFAGASSQFHSITIRATHGVSHSDLWAVGTNGSALKWDGSSWSTYETGTTETLYGVWAVATDDVWMVGANGTVLHWDGFQINTIDTDGLTANLYGVSSVSGRTYIVGSSGQIIEWDGTDFTVRTSGVTQALYAVYATSTSEVWAVGNNGVSTKWNGTNWTPATTGTTVPLNGLTKHSTSYYAVGNNGVIVKHNGVSWSTVTSGTAQNLYAAASILTGDPFSAFSPLPSNTRDLRGVYALSASSNLWVVGLYGSSFFYNGSTWTTASAVNSVITSVENFERLWMDAVVTDI
jgi:predicted membrane protein